MRAIIVGAGEVGYHVAEHLSRQGHEIVVVDNTADRLEYVRDGQLWTRRRLAP